MSFFTKMLEKENPQSYRYVVRGTYEGKPLWHYVEIPPEKHQAFERDVKNDTIDVESYGKILDSGWGDSPPPWKIL